MADLTKAVIDIGGVHLSLEGSETFVRGEIERFAATLIARASSNAATADDAGVLDAEAEKVESVDLPQPKKTRLRSARGAGQGCTAKVTTLLSDGYFKTGKTTSQVQAELKGRATPYAKNRISACLISFTKSGKLRRYEEAGDWQYMVP